MMNLLITHHRLFTRRAQRLTLIAMGAILAALCPVVQLSAQTYQGFGANTAGGLGQPIYHVTNLKDSGQGSLREALQGGNRTVVFDIAGDIVLAHDIKIIHPNITVDGSTAPAPGITLRNWGLVLHGSPRYYPGADAHDIIIRHIRVRDANADGIQIAWDAYNILLDHVSVGNSGDGNIDITHGAHDVTVLRSIVGRRSKICLLKPYQTTAKPSVSPYITHS